MERSAEAPPDWARLCEESSRATLFLHPRWMEAITRAYPRYRPLYLVATDAGTVAGMLPLVRFRRFGLDQYLSMPFGTHGGPLLATGADPATAGALAKSFRRLVRGGRVLRFEMTMFDPSDDLREALAPSLGHTFQDFRTHLVDLREGFDELWRKAYNKNTRNCVRMAEGAGVTVAQERGEDAIASLHLLHAAQSMEWEGIPPHSQEALRAIVDSLGEDARIYIARREGELLSACLFLEHGGREIHPWVSGSAKAARPLRAFHKLISDPLRDACARGLETWDFGGSGGNPKIEFFKESFGGKPVPVLRCFHVAEWWRKLRRGPAWD